MKNRYIVFSSPGIASLAEDELRAPIDKQIQVKTSFSTISSGTERANLIGDRNVSIERGSGDKPAVFPRTVGYCSSGTVIAVGENVRAIHVGDSVAVSWGKHSQYQNIDEGNVHIIEPGNTMRDAALGLIATFPMAAIRKTGLEIGEPAIVMGLGVLGLLAVQLLRAAGAIPVIAADPVKERREKALSLGADYAVDPSSDDFESQVRCIAGGGVKVAIEVTGYGKALDQVLDVMAKFGRVALLGCTRHSDFTIDYYRKVHGPGISLIGAHTMARPSVESSHGLWTTKDDMRAVLRLASGKRIKLEEMVEETHSPCEAGDVYTRLAAEKSFPVVQFDWSRI